MTSLIIIFGAALAVWGAVRKERRHVEYGVIAVVIGFAAAIILALQTPTDSMAGVPTTAPRPPSRHGLSARRVENDCLARVATQLVSPSSMRVIGNPVGADPVWDSAEGEWRWIVDVTGVNAYNVRIRGRFQCVVRPGPTWTVRHVN